MFAPYMIDSWIVATLVAIAAGAAGFFVVLRRASFAAHALPMAAFPGAAAASLFGWAELPGLLLFALGGVGGLAWAQRRQRADSATALVLVALMALGALFLSLSGHYASAVYALLFGQVLGVGGGAIAPALALGIAVPALLLLGFRPLVLSALSPDLAAARGVRLGWTDTLFLAVLAFAATLALPVVGALLVFSLMVGPAAASRLLTPRPLAAMALSVVLALAVVWAALALAFCSNWPVGFFVGTLSALVYVAARMSRR